ncbi:MAG: hypothetical protein ACYC9J_05080 [Sulfuricaulis sp.]
MKKTILAAVLSVLTLSAFADTTVNGKLSTLGYGLEAAFPMTPSVDGRLGINTLNYSLNKTSTSNGLNTNYSGDLKLNSLEALADWHPFTGSFRLSGGLVYNKNKLAMTAQAAGGTVNIGGVPYAIGAGESVNATIDFKKAAPYLGIGWGRTPKNTGLSFTSDLGILFQGSPETNVSTNIPGVAAANINKANSDLNDAIKKFKYYPVISIGVGYTF